MAHQFNEGDTVRVRGSNESGVVIKVESRIDPRINRFLPTEMVTVDFGKEEMEYNFTELKKV